jgi:nucleoid-associated protein YgaU
MSDNHSPSQRSGAGRAASVLLMATLALGAAWWVGADRQAWRDRLQHLFAALPSLLAPASLPPPASANPAGEPASSVGAAVMVVAPGLPRGDLTLSHPVATQPPPAATLAAGPPRVAVQASSDPMPPPETPPAAVAAAPAPAMAAPAMAAPAMAAAPAPAAMSTSAAPPEAERPSFDIVRVGPSGTAVVAGRAAPDASVAVLDNGAEIGRARADSSGQFVLIPTAPLPAGGQELTLAASEPGHAPTNSDASVVVVVPAPSAHPAAAVPATPVAPVPPPPALALLVPANAPPRLLQAPAPPAPGPPGQVGLDIVDYDDAGLIRFSGGGKPDSLVRAYVDDTGIGDAAVDGLGHWGLTPTARITVGDHRLRLDDLGPRGQVLSRVELPFQRAVLSPDDVQTDRVVVQPRENLWRIARHAYGHGMHYTLIYQANRAQIRDANLIYPGQIFVLPAIPDGPGGAARSPPSSQSR